MLVFAAGLFWALLFFGPFVFGGLAMWRGVTRPKMRITEPSCAKCGYGVRGLTTATCPECGRDLRQCGIITHAMEVRRRGTMPGSLAGWTAIATALSLAWILLTADWFYSTFAPRQYGLNDWSDPSWRLATAVMMIVPVSVWIAGLFLIVRLRRKLGAHADKLDADALVAHAQ